MPLPLRYELPPDRFLVRDGARFSRFFQSQGIDCKKLLLGNPDAFHSMPPELRLAQWNDWINPAWWQKEDCDFVLLYGGADPRLIPVARAIKQSKTILSLKLDTSIGAPNFWSDPLSWIYIKYWGLRAKDFSPPNAMLATLSRSVYHAGFSVYEKKVRALYDIVDWVFVENPLAVDRCAAWYASRSGTAAGKKIVLFPHPVENDFCYTSDHTKTDRILWIGRGGDVLKDDRLMVKVMARVLNQNPNFRAKIIGPGEEVVRRRLENMNPASLNRIEIAGILPNAQVRNEMLRSRIILVTSRSESFHIATAEALCCGCSAVAGPNLQSLKWMTSDQSGTIAKHRTVRSLSQALNHEIHAWKHNQRDPHKISGLWSGRFHVDRLGEQLINILSTNTIL